MTEGVEKAVGFLRRGRGSERDYLQQQREAIRCNGSGWRETCIVGLSVYECRAVDPGLGKGCAQPQE